jgi:hypothetical protein
MQGSSIQLEEKRSWSLVHRDTTAIILSTMESRAQDEGTETAQEQAPSSHSSIYEGHAPPRNETGFSQDTQDSGATGMSSDGETPADAQLSLLQSDQGNQNMSPRTFGHHQQIR